MAEYNNRSEISFLIEKFISNTCTREELDELLKQLDSDEKRNELAAVLKEHWEKTTVSKSADRLDWDAKFDLMMKEARYKAPVFNLPGHHKKMYRLVWAAAAAILLLLSVGNYLMFKNDKNKYGKIVKSSDGPHKNVHDISPGKNIAVLTLSDGSTIILDSVQNGTLAQQGNTKVIKLGNGQLSYNSSRKDHKEIVSNTISTPRGGHYEIILADGTKVWLNAGSSLKFPTAFSGNSRNVFLTGEGYFEVAKNPEMPFRVMANNMEVKVLGTHFNVNAYNDEETVATTLLEGSVKISKTRSDAHGSSLILDKSGQQANLNKKGEIKVTEVDVEEAIAWKNGKFFFNNVDIPAMMRQIARWYDVEIKYEGSIPKRLFTGKIDRNVNVSEVITMLEYAKVHLRVEGKTIIVGL